MVFAALLLLCAVPQNDGALRAAADRATDSPAAISESSSKDSSLYPSLPSAPEAKVAADPADASFIQPAGNAAQPISAGRTKHSFFTQSVFFRPFESPKQKKTWIALSLAGHGAATFDAYSTRRALSQGYGTEANPLLRPFAHSNALYIATQVSPAFMDYLGRKMMTSRHAALRKMWWLPQAAGTSLSVTAGVHNMNLVP